jgi:hypothetical protein
MAAPRWLSSGKKNAISQRRIVVACEVLSHRIDHETGTPLGGRTSGTPFNRDLAESEVDEII